MVQEPIHEISIPVGSLSLIGMKGCEEITGKVDKYLVDWRSQRHGEMMNDADFIGYCRDTYQLQAECPRFGTGEAKGSLKESVRGHDLYILSDMFNYGVTYKMYGMNVPMSPDDHYQDLKRIIAAVSGKARRINVIMPMLYEGRQHRRTSRESLDCALCLQELADMGVENLITFDAHDARVQNAIPLSGFENVHPTYQFLKAMVNNIPDIEFDRNHLMLISPDEGGMSRCMYYSSVLGVDLGMFYKRRDYTRVVNGRNPIVEHQYLGDSVEGKDIIIVDDMISSGESMLEVCSKLKGLKAGRIFVCTTFGLFCNGLEVFDEAYKNGTFYRVFTTNGVYQTPELLSRDWYESVDLSKYTAYFLDTLNHDMSVSSLLDCSDKIEKILIKKGLKEEK